MEDYVLPCSTPAAVSPPFLVSANERLGGFGVKGFKGADWFVVANTQDTQRILSLSELLSLLLLNFNFCLLALQVSG